MSIAMAHNATVVYDVLRLRIRALRSKDQQPQNVAEKNLTKGVSPTAVFRSPNRRKAVSIYNHVICSLPPTQGSIFIFT